MANKPDSYQQLSAELESIIDRMQSADIDIDAAVGAYERGMKIISKLENQLKAAENKVKKVKADFGDA